MYVNVIRCLSGT